MATVWLLNDLAEYRGKQELFTKQSPQKLARLRENAIIESAVASNRIEGIEIDRRRVGTVVFGKDILRDRNEQEVRGYQVALTWIHTGPGGLPLTVGTILRLHALSLDFLCIHPFRDGNGRVSRLLLLLSLYRMGFTAGRYISLEKIIEQSKARYYETLQQSSQGWHEGKHDLWPHANYLLLALKELYAEFERRVGEMTAPRGEKTEVVLAAVQRRTTPFALAEIEKDCPGVGRDWIRVILFQLKKEGRIACSGMGKGARWKHIL